MQILAASVDLAATALREGGELFLHAGYVSAYPRTFHWDMSELAAGHAPALQLDVADALRLEGEALGGAGDPGAAAAAVTGSGGGPPELLVTVAASFAVLALLYLVRDRLTGSRRVAGLAAALLAAVALPFFACGPDPLPSRPPWEGVTLRAYQHPEDATRVLLYGVIADGITNIRQPIDDLANIQDEVGLPTATPTEGEAYALRTYGIDGWGRPFRLGTREHEYRGTLYVVTSAGADGAFDTADDLAATVDRCDNGDWDQSRWAFFYRRDGGELVALFHRWPGKLFEYTDEERARALTGGDLFDVSVPPAWVDTTRQAAAYDQLAAAGDHEPLLLETYGMRRYE